MINSTPIISVLIPVYNGATTIGCALKECGYNEVKLIARLKKTWNVGSVVILKLINTARCPTDINATFVRSANGCDLNMISL